MIQPRRFLIPVAAIGANIASSVVKPSLALSLALLGSGLGLNNPAQAEEYMRGVNTVEDYRKALRGITTAYDRNRNSVRPPSQPATPKPSNTNRTAGVTPPAGIDTRAYSPSTDQTGDTSNGLSLYFGYDSAELTAAARNELSKLGQALSTPEFAQVYWMIEGHTDASGAADYNQQLSEARAAAARRFLIEQGGVAPDQLITVGKGESQLYDAKHPTASINRRVRLRPIGRNRQAPPTEVASSAKEAS